MYLLLNSDKRKILAIVLVSRKRGIISNCYFGPEEYRSTGTRRVDVEQSRADLGVESQKDLVWLLCCTDNYKLVEANLS